MLSTTHLKTTLATLLITAAAISIPASAEAKKHSGYSYGPKGSCYVSLKGKKVAGYKEYFNGKATGRCVLQ